MGSIRIGGGGAITATVDDGIERMLRRVVSQVEPALLEELEAEVSDVYRSAVKRWYASRKPRTAKQPYHSRDRLAYHIEVIDGGTIIRGRVTNDAWWAKYVKPKTLYYRSAYVELLRKPMRKAGRRLASKMAKRAAEELNNGR